MVELSTEVLQKLQSQKIPGLDLVNEAIYPSYDGYSILNIPSTICQWLGAPPIGESPLNSIYLEPLNADYRRVVLVLIDALGYQAMLQWMNEVAPIWRKIADNGILAPLTSITPSTTSAALTALWTGAPAARHGITGYHMWLKEYGVVANTINHSPADFSGDAGSLARAGFRPEEFLGLTTLGEHLAAAGVSSHVYQHYSIIHSGLSRMYFRSVEKHAFFTVSDLMVGLRKHLIQPANTPEYIYVYWSNVDTLSHRFGPGDVRVKAEFTDFSRALDELLLGPLSDTQGGETMVLLTADHGQITTQPDPHYELSNHPSLARRLHIRPTGENRLAFLYVRPGQVEAVREYIERTWPNQFHVLDSAYAVEMGLFGSPPHHPLLLDRVGDLTLIARGNAYLWSESEKNFLRGRHGGLSPDEMLVPLLAVRL